MSHPLKWFLSLSVAIHAAALVAWVDPAADAGNPEQVLLLDLTYNTGQTTSPPAIGSEDRSSQTATLANHPARPHRPVYTARHANIQPAIKMAPEPMDSHPPDLPDSKNMDSSIVASLAASSPHPRQEESNRQLRDSVMRLVTQRLNYPAIARRKGWQGVVTLELHIESNGLISDLQVNETSGYPALDQAAIKSLQTASIPGAKQWLHGHSIDMLIPVEYRLLDS